MDSNFNKKSALTENDGIEQPQSMSDVAAERIRNLRKKKVNPSEIISAILNHDKVALSKGITLVESTNPNHTILANEIINACLPHANQSVRIGITGVPGVGKSTFIEAFGMYLTSIGKKVAVLAIDPSSSISHGSILGDKTRMEDLVRSENAFIRPSASGDSLGGVARKTRESIILCEACGFDVILIETVGVGQSETAVHSMVDFFLLLNLAGAGDELQGIKRGIMEMADAIVINKADGDNLDRARNAKLDVNRALHLFPPKTSKWQPKVKLASAYYNEGIAEIWDMLSAYFTLTKENNYFDNHRKEQNKYWMMETIQEQILARFNQTEGIESLINLNKQAVQENEKSPFVAATEVLDFYFKNQK
ncbi:methylmalonyl Co-A mutase-associated GTPase MeaB [Flavobacterium sp. I3-2]|uniref:methylmalonyl Co-A mutase-associated GTPase MeaB n=1 Tax=Flavobacterium sp. I3-2 TaxID=2748319 RepID=UPI0015ABED70|nr:methylmalonyl Co-A mutase-associated GTPase MeaB [Flavobacterium sp. I3-2]